MKKVILSILKFLKDFLSPCEPDYESWKRQEYQSPRLRNEKQYYERRSYYV
ncbi:MAG: hypothetical protein KDD45_05455 [Bdellovibrionales bacterium]|nr:hypothetical protein [Bdellovibrionales bacterium]